MRLFDGVAGRPGVGSSGTQPPAAVTGYNGPFLAGTMFSVLTQMAWLDGYWWWVTAANQTALPQKFALWNIFSTTGQQVVPGSVVTSGALTPGIMNFVPLASPVQLAPGALYNAATGWQTNTGGGSGFPDSTNQFGAAQPYAGGIVNGILTGWSDLGGTNQFPAASLNYGHNQGLFSVAGTDPAVNMPNAGSNSAIFWPDVEISATAPVGYAGSYRMYPNMADLGNFTLDTANGFTLGVEFSLTQDCVVNNAWFYSPATVTQLPSDTGFYRVSDQALVVHNAAPSWSGAAGSGWISAPFTGAVLQAGVNYKYVVFQGLNVIWNAAVANYYSTGFGGAGLTAGPIVIPNAAGATPGQQSYHQAGVISYPDTIAGPFSYGLDFEVTPLPPAAAVRPSGIVAADRGSWKKLMLLGV
jgi:hypothetical protein